jgi:D-glycero-alpha-D-manno-heptose-7-phosphate kinase
MQELTKRVLLFYTEQQRDADKILKQQSEGTKDRMSILRAMRDLAQEMRLALGGGGGLDEFARLLHEGWELKRSLGFGISTGSVDAWYEQARKLGAQGGKLLGAGGGGFLLLIAPPERHNLIRDALGTPRELTFGIDRRGGRVIFISDHQRLLHNQ